MPARRLAEPILRAARELRDVGARGVSLQSAAACAASTAIQQRCKTAPPSPIRQNIADRSNLARALAYEHGEGLPKDSGRRRALLRGGRQRQRRGRVPARLDVRQRARRRARRRHRGGAVRARCGGRHAYARTARARLGDVQGMLPDCMRPSRRRRCPTRLRSPETDDGPTRFGDLPPEQARRLHELVYRVCAANYGIEPRLALAVIAVESNFDAAARSAKHAQRSDATDPGNGGRFNVRNPVRHPRQRARRPFVSALAASRTTRRGFPRGGGLQRGRGSGRSLRTVFPRIPRRATTCVACWTVPARTAPLRSERRRAVDHCGACRRFAAMSASIVMRVGPPA